MHSKLAKLSVGENPGLSFYESCPKWTVQRDECGVPQSERSGLFDDIQKWTALSQIER